MRHVKFQSLVGQDEVDMDGILFKNHEIKSVSDEMATMILKNRNFVEVADPNAQVAQPVIPQTVAVPKNVVDALIEAETHQSSENK